MTSRQRMLASMACEPVDYVPCSFMIFEALRAQCADQVAFVLRQVELGLDATVDLGAWASGRPELQADLPGMPVEPGPLVEVRHWREAQEGAEHELLCKEITTPDGALTARVNLTPDWSGLQTVPLFDDWLVPRSREFLVKGRADLSALRHVLAGPSAQAEAGLAALATEARAFADQHGLLLQAGWGVGLEAGLWLVGFERLAWAAIEEPAFVDELVELLHGWNVARMRPVLEAGVDLFVRRGWYESTAFWSPKQFRRWVLPTLKAEADLAHDSGARFGYISTTGTMPILDQMLEAGVDVLIGVDPLQDVRVDLSAMRGKTAGRMCLWGGVNGFVTVERGSQIDVRKQVRDAVDVLGKRGLILSPVDNVTDGSEHSWGNVEALIDEWRRVR